MSFLILEKNGDIESRQELLASKAEQRSAERKSTSSLLNESEAEKRLSSVSSTSSSQTSSDVILSENSNSENKQTIVPSHFNRTPNCSRTLPSLSPAHDHTILFRPHLVSNKPPRPYPDQYRDSWDRIHVRMPCSPENLYPTLDKKIQKRWELIEGTLLQQFATSKDLEEALLVYNYHYKNKWNFESWHSYCNILLSDAERDDLFTSLLPNMVNLALQLPTIVTQSPKLLQRGIEQSVTFSQQQIACLLANAFFCTYPRRNSLKNSEFSTYPDINFSKLFRGIKDVVHKVKTEKLRCLLNYFRRVLSDMPCGTVTFTRKVLQPQENRWENSNDKIVDLCVVPHGTIEDDGEGMLQVDFANRMIGGGVVGEGCVQEEIRFLLCPELILARLFTEKLEPNESLLITGCERFSSYKGYAQSFKFEGNYIDIVPRDRWGRRYTQVVAIDAHVFHNYVDQFKKVALDRELEKALCGFKAEPENEGHLSAVATGNWGCGAFGGDIHLKALIQLMAASIAKRDVVYFTFGDKEFCEELRDMHDFLQLRQVTVSELYQLLLRYSRAYRSNNGYLKLYPYLKKKYEEFHDDTDDGSSSCNDDNPLEIRGIPCEIPTDMIPPSEYMPDTP